MFEVLRRIHDMVRMEEVDMQVDGYWVPRFYATRITGFEEQDYKGL